MTKTEQWRVTEIYALIHFLVDLCCVTLVSTTVLHYIPDATGMLYFIAILLYDFTAFVLELPIGIFLDYLNKNTLAAAFGCIVVGIASLLAPLGVFSCIIAGIGNALFHSAGGIDVMNIDDGKASHSGVFVATGAMGVFLGGKAGVFGIIPLTIIPVLVMFLSAITMFLLYKKISGKNNNQKIIVPELTSFQIIAVVCLFLTVCLRSYVGCILSFDWKANIFLAFLAACSLVLGKALGGFIADKYGYVKASIVSLGFATILWVFSFDNPLLGCLAIIFFNMTMPITLSLLSQIFPQNKGMAFGILTVALFSGFLPSAFFSAELTFSIAGLCLMTVISLGLLLVGIFCKNKK